jgi:GNAT superfamily N-acetyltransferase
MRGIMTRKSSDEKPLFDVTFDHDDGREDANIAELLRAEMAARFGPRDEEPLSILARAEGGALIGGVNGVTHWRWFYVRHLWVAEAWRGAGLGRGLMAEAERAARARGCVGIYLDTFDPSAAAFYERCGFARFGAIEDFPLGRQRIFLCKRLEQSENGP